MRIIFLLLFSATSFASSFIPEELIGQELVDAVSFSSKESCEGHYSKPCVGLEFKTDPSVMKLKELYGEMKFDEESCSGELACVELLASKVCGVGRSALIDELYTEVYCVEVVGKELVIDAAKKAAKDAASALASATQAAKSKVKSLRECLAGVIDLLVIRNASKNLNTSQVEQMVLTYQPIMALLQAVSGVTAKQKIQAVTADGVLVTEADKTALTQEIDRCLAQ